MFHGHLRKQKTTGLIMPPRGPCMWPAAIKPPVPERKDQHIYHPQQPCRPEHLHRRIVVPRQILQ